MIWHREGETWKVALGHSIPLSPASRAAPRRPAIGGVAPGGGSDRRPTSLSGPIGVICSPETFDDIRLHVLDHVV